MFLYREANPHEVHVFSLVKWKGRNCFSEAVPEKLHNQEGVNKTLLF